MIKQPGLTTYKADRAYHGYTLLAPLEGTGVYLLDMQGDIVHRWQLPSRPGDYGYLLDDGNLLAGVRTAEGPVSFAGKGGAIVEMDWEGNILWEHVEDTLHHDFCRMDNGNTMLLGWELVPPDVAGRVRGGKADTEGKRDLWSDYLREVTPDGQTAWLWHAYEHLDPETDAICPIHLRDEWTHANTCRVLPDGNVLISFRLLDTVAVVDKRSGKFSWKWGRDQLGHPHDPNLLDNGNILIFDNGWHAITAPFPGSRIVEVDPRTNEIQWEYKTMPRWEFFSAFISGAQRLPNGNTLICEGMTGRLFEITHGGEVVWEYVNPFFGYDARFGHVNRVFRAYRYGPDFPGLKGKNLSPQSHAWLSHLYRSPG